MTSFTLKLGDDFLCVPSLHRTGKIGYLYGNYKVPEKLPNVEEGYDSMPKLIPDYDDSEDDNSEGWGIFQGISGQQGR